jgi:hypothetical protein
MPQTPTELLLRRMRKRQGRLKSGRYGIPVLRQCYQRTDYRFYACRIPLPLPRRFSITAFPCRLLTSGSLGMKRMALLRRDINRSLKSSMKYR